MSNFQDIPHPTREQRKHLETAFLKSFGLNYTKMRKEDMALMILNQSTNYQKIAFDAVSISKIGLAMKRQRDHYHKLIRKKYVKKS